MFQLMRQPKKNTRGEWAILMCMCNAHSRVFIKANYILSCKMKYNYEKLNLLFKFKEISLILMLMMGIV